MVARIRCSNFSQSCNNLILLTSHGTGQKEGPLLSRDFSFRLSSCEERLIGKNFSLLILTLTEEIKFCFLATLTFLEKRLFLCVGVGVFPSSESSAWFWLLGVIFWIFLILLRYLRFRFLFRVSMLFFAPFQELMAAVWSCSSKRIFRSSSRCRCNLRVVVSAKLTRSLRIFFEAVFRCCSHRCWRATSFEPRARLNFSLRPLGIELSCLQRVKKREWCWNRVSLLY